MHLMLSTSNASAFLLFQVGPVQEFIAQARKLRDLWSGSYLISHLAGVALQAVSEASGAEAIVYPAASEAPADRTPCIPNRFLALLPAERAGEIAVLAERAVRAEWASVSGKVKRDIEKRAGSLASWDALWEQQVARFPTIDWLVHPWADDVTAPASPEGASEWARHYAATEWLFAARKNGRAFSQWRTVPGSAGAHRDHLDGRNEALGGDYASQKRFRTALQQSDKRDFKGEQLYSALSLIKRRWDDLCLHGARDWFPDNSFLAQTDKEMESDSEDAERYYAVLMMDGDDMGQWLSGEKGGHGVTRDYHRDLSAKLARFARGIARPIVEERGGHLVYSGGDDALALLPAAHAIDCAATLVGAFGELMGPPATSSVGLAIGHVKSPLQDTIQAARDAEHFAKAREGKNAFCLAIRKRSGESVRFRAPWSSGVAGVWSELRAEPRVSGRVAQHFAARVQEQVIVGGSATGAKYAPQWTPTLRDALALELRHVLSRQAALPRDAAEKKAQDWMQRLLGTELGAAALSPENFLHFWLAWAFLRRTEPAHSIAA
jgi:CRISPR-associated protein Cmr2